jgi:hypothetical protein
MSREGLSLRHVVGWLAVTMFFVVLLTFMFTDVWPYMHEVIWQHSWRPVCNDGHGHMEFCRP